MSLSRALYNLFSDLGDWLITQSKYRDTAIILVILSLFTPLGFIFASAFIASAHRRKKKRR